MTSPDGEPPQERRRTSAGRKALIEEASRSSLLRAVRGLLRAARISDRVEVVADEIALGRRDLLTLERIVRLLGEDALDLGILRGGLAFGRLALHEVGARVLALAEPALDLGLLGARVVRRLGARTGALAGPEPFSFAVAIGVAFFP